MSLETKLGSSLVWFLTSLQTATWPYLDVTQQSRHIFCSNASRMQNIHKIYWTVPYDSTIISNIMDSSPMICKDSLVHFFNVFRYYACQWLSRMLIVVDGCLSILEAFVPQKILLWLVALSPFASISMWRVSAVVFWTYWNTTLQKLT